MSPRYPEHIYTQCLEQRHSDCEAASVFMDTILAICVCPCHTDIYHPSYYEARH